jgi:hypothetical protein
MPIDAEQALQAPGDLAVGQAGLLIEFDDGGLGIGAQLSRCGTQGVGRLQWVPPLNAATAPAAPADVEVELAVNGLARDLDLVLMSDVGLVEGSAAVGATLGQRRLVDLVDLFWRRRLAVRLGAVILAGLATRLLGLGRGFALGEGPSGPRSGNPWPAPVRPRDERDDKIPRLQASGPTR